MNLRQCSERRGLFELTGVRASQAVLRGHRVDKISGITSSDIRRPYTCAQAALNTPVSLARSLTRRSPATHRTVRARAPHQDGVGLSYVPRVGEQTACACRFLWDLGCGFPRLVYCGWSLPKFYYSHYSFTIRIALDTACFDTAARRVVRLTPLIGGIRACAIRAPGT